MFDFISDIFNEKNECSICLENKVLKQFCEIHDFCNQCNKNWIKQNIYCPLCRQRCVNRNYIEFNFELKNMEIFDFPKDYFDNYFTLWHQRLCIRKKHKFHIRKHKDEYVFMCLPCNIEQIFPIILNE